MKLVLLTLVAEILGGRTWKLDQTDPYLLVPSLSVSQCVWWGESLLLEKENKTRKFQNTPSVQGTSDPKEIPQTTSKEFIPKAPGFLLN